VRQSVSLPIPDSPHADAPDLFAVFLGRHGNQGLFLGLAAADALLAPADIRLVDFDAAR
jgi:hypothetical protein